MNSREPFGPGAAEKLGQHGFGLVIQSMGGGYGIHHALGHQLTEPAVAQAAGGFLDGLGGLACVRIGAGRCGRVYPGLMEGQPESVGQVEAEIAVRIGFSSAKAVVQMGDVEHQPEFSAPLGKDAQQSDRVRPAGNANRETQAWLEQKCVERYR